MWNVKYMQKKGACTYLQQIPFMWSDMLTSVEVLLGLSIIIGLDSSIFGSSRLMIIDRKTLQYCNLSAASWLALSRDMPGGFTKLSHPCRVATPENAYLRGFAQ